MPHFTSNEPDLFLMCHGNEPNTTNTVKAFVDRKLHNGTPPVKDWPPQSLDLNII